MKRLVGLLAALALLCAGCAARSEEDGYRLYYAAEAAGNGGGDAIGSYVAAAFDGSDTPLDEDALAQSFAERLLERPAREGLYSPFPGGTTLQSFAVAGGRATVDLSAEYARLSGVDLSLADYCMTLTLTQFSRIRAVRITVNGRELPYRQTQPLLAADALLSSDEDVLRPINVSLWFLDTGTGELREQQQTLALYEGQTRVNAVIDALRRGPDGDDALEALLPADLAAASSRIDEGICYVNLNAPALMPEDGARWALTLESIARSLRSLSGVEDVQLLVDGTAAYETAAAALAADEGEALET